MVMQTSVARGVDSQYCRLFVSIFAFELSWKENETETNCALTKNDYNSLFQIFQSE